MEKLTLLSAASATSTDIFTFGGQGTLHVYGTWDGATASFQTSADGTNWVTPDNGSFTANKAVNVNLAGLVRVRVAIASAGGSTSLTAILEGVN